MEAPNRFGEWLRQRREELKLTRGELARRIGCSVSLLRKIEDGERRPSAQVAEQFAAVFNIPPAERPAFIKYARGDWRFASVGTIAQAPWHALSTPLHSNLPVPLTSFIGREHETNEIVQLIEEHKIVTLTGPDGLRLDKPIVGREQEVETLRHALHAVQRGTGQCVIISGDAGIGKVVS